MSTQQPEAIQAWLGRREVCEALLTEQMLEAYRATLGPHLWQTESHAPPGLHWCLAPSTAQAGMDELGIDGHPQRGGFLPPVPLPRRMWAGVKCTPWHRCHLASVSSGCRPLPISASRPGAADSCVSSRSNMSCPALEGWPFASARTSSIEAPRPVLRAQPRQHRRDGASGNAGYRRRQRCCCVTAH